MEVKSVVDVFNLRCNENNNDDIIRKVFQDSEIHDCIDTNMKFNNITIGDNKIDIMICIFKLLNNLSGNKLDLNYEFNFDNAVFEYHIYEGEDCKTPFTDYADNDNGETNISFVICLFNDMKNSGFLIGDELIDITPEDDYTYKIICMDGDVIRRPVVTSGKMETIELIVPFQINMSH